MIKVKKKHIQIIQIMFIIYLNLLSTKWNFLGIIISLAEWLVIYFCIFNKRYEEAFLILIISMATAFEINSFVYYKEESRILYSIYRMPYVSNHFFIVSLFLVLSLMYLKYKSNFHSNVKKHKYLYTLLRFIVVIIFTGTLTGILGYIVNDNEVQSTSWYLHNYLRVTSQYLAVASIIFITVILLIANSGFYLKITNLLENYLVAMGIMALFSGLVGWHGYYGSDANILLMPLSVSLCPIIMIFPLFDRENKNRKSYFLLAVIFLAESMRYGSLMGSKFYVIPFLIIFIYFFKETQRRKIIDILVVAAITALLLFFIVSDFNILTFNEYTKWKFTQLIGFFRFSDKGFMEWYMGIGESPRYRIEEFINIFLEYCKKPMYFLFGKGYGGTIKHLWGNLRWDIVLANYSEDQVSSRTYAVMHESLNKIFISNGVVGVWFFISMIYRIMKSFMKSKWAIAGLIWFAFYWGSYQSWWIGAVMFVLTLYEGEKYIMIAKNDQSM